MPDKEDILKVGGTSAASAILPYAVLGIGGYILIKKLGDSELIPGFDSLSNIAGGIVETVTNTTETITETVTETITETIETIKEVPKDIYDEAGKAITKEPKFSEKEEAALTARAEPNKYWSLSKETIADIRDTPPTPGAWVEKTLENIVHKPTPTGVLSEYTQKEMKGTTFYDPSKPKTYRGSGPASKWKSLKEQETANISYIPPTRIKGSALKPELMTTKSKTSSGVPKSKRVAGHVYGRTGKDITSERKNLSRKQKEAL